MASLRVSRLSCLSSRISFISRLPLGLGSYKSMMSLHSTVASARSVSSLSGESMSWSLVPHASNHTTLSMSSTTRISLFDTKSCFSSHSASAAGIWLGGKKKLKLPSIVKAGEPVLHERAMEVKVEDIKSERVQMIIDDMIRVMRKAPGVGLAAPQIGIPLRVIVLEDKEQYINLDTKEEIEAQDRRPFGLLVILNPKLKKKSNRTALFFEGCLSVPGFSAVVERCLEVEVSGFDRNGEPIKINASGWQARILQHECDHLDGTLYVDKMLSRTFRTAENFDMPLAQGCPKLGPRKCGVEAGAASDKTSTQAS